MADIQDIHYEYNLKQQIKVESKDEMKERLKKGGLPGLSPDIGDALCCTFAPGIEMKLREVDRVPFGIVSHHLDNSQREYDPLTYGLGGN